MEAPVTVDLMRAGAHLLSCLNSLSHDLPPRLRASTTYHPAEPPACKDG